MKIHELLILIWAITVTFTLRKTESQLKDAHSEIESRDAEIVSLRYAASASAERSGGMQHDCEYEIAALKRKLLECD